jgi:hypothetical protein
MEENDKSIFGKVEMQGDSSLTTFATTFTMLRWSKKASVIKTLGMTGILYNKRALSFRMKALRDKMRNL